MRGTEATLSHDDAVGGSSDENEYDEDSIDSVRLNQLRKARRERQRRASRSTGFGVEDLRDIISDCWADEALSALADRVGLVLDHAIHKLIRQGSAVAMASPSASKQSDRHAHDLARINAQQNVKNFGKAAGMQLELDEVNTCVVAACKLFTLHITYEVSAKRLYLYAPVAECLPSAADASTRLVVFQLMLEGSLLGGQVAGGGIGISTDGDGLVLMHATIDMHNSSSHALKNFVPPFLETALEWLEKIESAAAMPAFFEQLTSFRCTQAGAATLVRLRSLMLQMQEHAAAHRHSGVWLEYPSWHTEENKALVLHALNTLQLPLTLSPCGTRLFTRSGMLTHDELRVVLTIIPNLDGRTCGRCWTEETNGEMERRRGQR